MQEGLTEMAIWADKVRREKPHAGMISDLVWLSPTQLGQLSIFSLFDLTLIKEIGNFDELQSNSIYIE